MLDRCHIGRVGYLTVLLLACPGLALAVETVVGGWATISHHEGEAGYLLNTPRPRRSTTSAVSHLCGQPGGLCP